MNILKRLSTIFVTGLLLGIFYANSAMAQEPTRASGSVRSEVLTRSLIARGGLGAGASAKKSNQEKSSGQKVVDALNSPAGNAVYGSAESMVEVAKKHSSYLVKKAKELIKTVVKSSGKAGSVVSKSSALLKGGLKILSKFDVTATWSTFAGAVAGKDPILAAESLLNSAGSGYSAAGGAKVGMVLGSVIAPGPGTVFGGFIGGLVGALAWNEVVAPQVEKAGDYASNRTADNQVKANKEQHQLKKDFDLVYPHGYLGPVHINKLTGERYEVDLNPFVLHDKAESIRRAERKKQADKKEFEEKVDQEIQKITKKKDWKFTPDETKPEQKTAFKIKKTVPDVTNKSLENAFSILKNAGFILAPVEGGDPAPSKKLVQHVQMQLPAGDQPAYQDKRVILTLYSDVEIPDVVGMTAEKALKKLQKAGFSMKSKGCDPPPSKELSHLAESQIPNAKTPGKGYDSIEVVFYPKYQELVVPDITKLKPSEAIAVLEEMGLKLGAEPAWGERATTKKQVGKIQKQQPAEGEPIEPGGEVKAWVYYTVVPKVLTKSKSEAESAMKTAWFKSSLTEGEANEYKDKWDTIYFQSLEPEKKFAETDVQVTLKYYINPEKEKIAKHPMVSRWEGFSGKNKTRVIVYWDVTSVDENGVVKGKIISPKQNIPLAKSGKFLKFAHREMPFHGELKGNKITIYYGIISGKGITKGVWDVKNNTIEGHRMISSPLVQNGKWHKVKGLHVSLKKK